MSFCVQAFQNYADPVVADGDLVQRVAMNEFGLLHENSTENHLLTENTNVCAGLALFEQSGKAAGLLHVFSDAAHHPFGLSGHRLHIQNLWRQVAARLPEGDYDAVFFGGRKPDGTPEFDFNDSRDDPFAHIAFVSSYWMHTALFETVSAQPNITITADYRFMNAPHDALLSRRDRTLYIANSDTRLPYNVYRSEEKTRAARVVQGWGLTLSSSL